MKTTKQINWNISKSDQARVKAIALRAHELNANYSVMHIEMDLIATHANGCKLDFEKLLGADTFNLAHDVFGIARHLDRTTGKLEGFFVPRCAKPTAKEVRQMAGAIA